MKRNNKKKNLKFDIYLFLIVFASLFMSMGFATDNLSACRSAQLSTWSNNTVRANCVTNHNLLYLSSQSPALTASIVGNRNNSIYRITTSGNPVSALANQSGLAKPVIYLKNSVLVNSGNGDANTPYTLK